MSTEYGLLVVRRDQHRHVDVRGRPCGGDLSAQDAIWSVLGHRAGSVTSRAAQESGRDHERDERDDNQQRR